MDSGIFTNIKSIFFDNKTIKQTLFKNTFWLTLGLGISKFLKMALIIYVARILGATDYGKFTFALSFISLFIIFSDLGLVAIVIREFSREKEREEEFNSLLSLKIILILGTLILILITSFFITSDVTIRKIIWILALFSMIEGFSTLIYVFFQAIQRMEYQAWATILESFAVTALGFFVILNYPSVENLSLVYLVTSLIALVFVIIFFHFKVFPLRVSWRKSVWQRFLSASWPLALSSVFTTVYNYTDSVMMGHWKLMIETGWYNAAYRIVAVGSIPLGLVFASFYPMVSKFFKESKEKLQEVWNYQIETVILFTVPFAIGGIVLAPRIIGFTYGAEFAPAVLALQILIIMAGITFFCTSFQSILIAANQEKKFFLVTSLAAVVNVVLNLILIPRFTLYGAAAATTITYLLIFLLFFIVAARFTPIQPFNLKSLLILLAASFSSVLMYLVISQPRIYQLNVFLSIIIGAAVYLIGLLAFKKLSGYLRFRYAR